ncbi:MAG: acylphosphatase [Planctomycetota bacterium]|nr:acylphosphatase [Planctomycetota bacterium]
MALETRTGGESVGSLSGFARRASEAYNAQAMAMVRYILLYTGDVQGVGFRYTACRAAAGLAVTGYARNLPDGRVQCVVEGETEQADEFCRLLAERMRPHIRGQTRQDAPPTGEFASFGIRH